MVTTTNGLGDRNCCQNKSKILYREQFFGTFDTNQATVHVTITNSFHQKYLYKDI